ncbi:Flavonol synthase/flavanone 3-hydroxylase [Acorus calamus]|uniref:Flavonol synthase/flavanone 3-hydroxylase n=1 Tax=Acorus calamus TaxID=4465 RepID=A0AAV9D374_ACOCL|nr:Flavonol synthase/flavanone 3-hydroxylase [Acorus calamus]
MGYKIINHGVGGDVMEKMHGVGKEFFEMPVEDRACLYLEDPPFEIALLRFSFISKFASPIGDSVEGEDNPSTPDDQTKWGLLLR